MTVVELAPEAVEGVRTAKVALQEEAARLTAVGDPIAPAVLVLAQAGEATNRLLVDVFLKTQATHEATGKLIQEGRKPWTRDETRVLVTQLDRTLLHRWAQFNRTTLAVCVAATVAFGVACGIGGWWYRGDGPILVGVRAGAEKCDDRPDGGRLCWIPVWERLPSAK